MPSSVLFALLACAPDPLAPVEVDPSHDWDGDGFSEAEGDCDDGRDGVNPAAPEVCDNGVDDDCDGLAVSCDDDGDGVTTADGDCDDSDDRVYPGAMDVCSNGLDEDCSGQDSTCAWSGDLALPPSVFAPGGFVFAVGDLDGSPGPEVLRSGSLLDVLTVDGVEPTVRLSPWGAVTNDIAPSLDPNSLEAAERLPDDASARLLLGLPRLDGGLDRGALLLTGTSLDPGTTAVSTLLDEGVVIRGAPGQQIGRAATVVDGAQGRVVAVGAYGSAPMWIVPSDLPQGEYDVDDVALVTFSEPFLTAPVGSFLHAVDIDGDGDEEIAASTEPAYLLGPAKVYVVEAQGPDRTLDMQTEALDASGTGLFSFIYTDSADVDGDGYDDLIAGFYTDEPGGSASLDSPGAVHVHLGAAARDATEWVDGRALGAGDLAIAGAAPGGWFGAILAPAGDVDGDGGAELWVGAPLEADNRGAAYLVSSGASGVVDLAQDPDAILARVEGRAGEYLGTGLVVDDFDGDEADDLLLASLQALYVLPGGVLP